jgi:Fic family protein
MIFAVPRISADHRQRLESIDALYERLRSQVGASSHWMGTLRREARAESVASSTAIEGFDVSRETAVALVSGRASADPGDDHRLAVASYARAMAHVAAMADDPHFRWVDRVILDLHFDACSFQSDRHPGRWRTGPIAVTADGGGLAYRGPEAASVPALMSEVVAWLAADDPDLHPVVCAAMAHLHAVSVHPFEDGNGRLARILQSLVLAREGVLSPEFGSIEPYLAAHTSEYYAALQAVQGGSYQPARDASAWIDFCIRAHDAQARRRLAQIDAAAARWSLLERLVESRGWPDRLVIALEQALVGGSDRATYAEEAGVSSVTASHDLRRLVDAGLIVQRGSGRFVRYEATEDVRGDVNAAVAELG